MVAELNENGQEILARVWEADGISAADLSRACSFSAQTASVQVRDLERRHLIRRGEPVKGKVGKPQQPLRVNADGAFSFGLWIDQSGSELRLVDLTGQTRDILRQSHDAPSASEILAFTEAGLEDLTSALDPVLQARIHGLSVSGPQGCRETATSVREHLAVRAPYPIVAPQGDPATIAEFWFGHGLTTPSFACLTLGAPFTGGIVRDGRLFSGCADLGQLHPLNGKTLGARLSLSALSDGQGHSTEPDWTDAASVETWISQTADELAYALTSVAALVGVTNAIVGGDASQDIRDRIAEAVRGALNQLGHTGQIHASTLSGDDVRVANAFQPLAAKFFGHSA